MMMLRCKSLAHRQRIYITYSRGKRKTSTTAGVGCAHGIIPRRFSRATGWCIPSNRGRLAGRQDGAASPELFADPSWFSPPFRGRVSPILPPTLPLTRPLSRVRGAFTGECGGRLTGSTLSPVAGPAGSGQGRAPGAPAPGGGCASLPNAPLDAAVWPIHRRDLGAPGPAQGRCPSGATPPAGRGGSGPFTPLRGPGCCEGSPAVTTPKGTLLDTRVRAAGRGSVLGVVTARSVGARWHPVARNLGGAWRHVFDAILRAGTA